MFNSANLNPQGIISSVQQGLVSIRTAMNIADNLYAASSGIALADLTGIGMTSGDASAILSACADANALNLYYNTGLPPGTYPQPSSAYIYGTSQRIVIGLRPV
jgi:hypothetical protein